MAAVQFILGTSGTGKTQRCIDAVCKALTSGGDEPLVLLVPEQATYQIERSILSAPGIRGFSRLHVLSFNRLAFRLSPQHKPGAELSTVGKQMVLHRLLLEVAEELTVYSSATTTLGLAGKMAELIGDLQHNSCTAEQIALLSETLAAEPNQLLAAQKWADIATVFAAYEAWLSQKSCPFSNPDTELNTAKDRAAAAAFLNGARIWVDGFSGFSIQERDVLIELLKISDAAEIALCLDAQKIDLDNTDEAALDPYSLFAATEQTYCQLLRIATGCGLSVKDPVILGEPKRFSQAPALAAIETALASDAPAEPMSAEGTVRIAACANVRAEALWTAGQIRDLVKNHRYRYRDIAVVVPDMDGYRHYLESAFAQYELPYFLDRPRQMKTHPLIELIGAALQAAAGSFRLSDVLSYLKSPLAEVGSEQIDALENYCRAFDIQSPEWQQKAPWDFAGAEDKKHFDEPALDALRRKVIAPLRDLQKMLQSTEMIGVEPFIKALWTLLETLNTPAVLAAWDAEEPAETPSGHRQVFARLLELADEMAAIFDGVEVMGRVWMSILTDAVSTITIKLIPPTLDQLLVGSIERSRHPDIKAIFLIGAAQKQFPIPAMGARLLTEQDYRLASSNLELANPYEQHLTHRPYLAYIALTRAAHRVYLSWPLTDDKGAEVVPWSGIDQLLAMFTDVAVEYPGSIDAPETIQTPTQLSHWLSGNLGRDHRHSTGGSEPDDNRQLAAGILDRMADAADPALKAIASHVHTSLAYDNTAELDAAATEQLFTFPMTTSASRLGLFASCPYQYFARYTLRLQRRQILQFEPMDVGTFYHDVLEATFKALQSDGRDWADLSDDELIAVCDGQSERIISENPLLINFMRRQEHHRYIIMSAREVLRSFVPMLATLSRAGRFKQTQAEMAFGPSDEIKLIIPLDDERTVQLAGRIDRLDVAEVDGQNAAIVFDYKTSGKSVNFAGMLYGLDLQLPIYLLAAHRVGRAHQNENTISAGAFFLPINTGIESATLSETDTEKAAFNKAAGLFDGRFFEALDTAVSGWSSYYNFYVNKEGTPYSYYKNSGALKPDDFAALMSHTAECIKKLVADLAAGTIAITPYRIAKDSPCSWCDYRALCRFDWQINDYNILENVGKEEALEKMKDK